MLYSDLDASDRTLCFLCLSQLPLLTSVCIVHIYLDYHTCTFFYARNMFLKDYFIAVLEP